jgi:aminopeptidase C
MYMRRFERELDRLQRKERLVNVKGSYEVGNCLLLANNNLTKHNFFTDKFDTTGMASPYHYDCVNKSNFTLSQFVAWNDYDAIPRTVLNYSTADHGGSRKRLMFLRKQTLREVCQQRMEKKLGNQDQSS